MPFTLEALARLRPYVFHLTARDNLPRIRRLGIVEPASRLAEKAGRIDLVMARRRGHVPITVDGETVVLRDQAPLHAGNMRLDEAWSFEQFVRHLNDRVFFWPGNRHGPISYGVRHFERYKGESPVILRTPFADLLKANTEVTPLFCRYNSGSPRWSRGIAAPRGASTFIEASKATFCGSAVVEVTVTDVVRLPDTVMVGAHPHGPWISL